MKSIFFNTDVLDAEKKIMNSLGIPSILLMENAGLNSSAYILSGYKDYLQNPVIILAGKGNNAGDGFVISRNLANAGIKSKVLLLYPSGELKGDAKVNFEIITSLDSGFIEIADLADIAKLCKYLSEGKQVIVDAIFGIGFRGELDENVKQIVEKVNSLEDKIVVSVDTPSGLENYNQFKECVKADCTITMGVKKFHSLFYFGKEHSGHIETVSIGVPYKEFDKYNVDQIWEPEREDIKRFIPKRGATSYKYSAGKVFILAGAEGFTGAAYLCAQSALRAGSGAVILGVPESLDVIMEKKLTDVVKFPLPETKDKSFALSGYDEIKKKIEWSDVTLIGPGIGRNAETLELVRKILSELDHNYVIDADGLFALNGHTNLLKDNKSNIIFTPHFGEFAGLLNITSEELINDFYNLSKSFAKEFKLLMVLKNAPTIITDGEKFYINPTGHENLATMGTGDVLSGIISGFYSQNADALQSSIAGTYLHGFCGDVLYEQTGDSSTIASDLIPLIPKVKHYLSS